MSTVPTPAPSAATRRARRRAAVAAVLDALLWLLFAVALVGTLAEVTR